MKKYKRKAKPKSKSLGKISAKDKQKILKYAKAKKRKPRSIKTDLERMAKVPGRRESRWGNIYYEYRKNRSDKNPKVGI